MGPVLWFPCLSVGLSVPAVSWSAVKFRRSPFLYTSSDLTSPFFSQLLSRTVCHSTDPHVVLLSVHYTVALLSLRITVEGLSCISLFFIFVLNWIILCLVLELVFPLFFGFCLLFFLYHLACFPKMPFDFYYSLPFFYIKEQKHGQRRFIWR